MNDDIYEYKGQCYRLIRRVEMKIPSRFWRFVMGVLSPSSQLKVQAEFSDEASGRRAWIPAVLYMSIDGGYYYTREAKDFFEKFNRWENPDQSRLKLEE